MLFCDLVGSTELVCHADPEDARETLRQYQSLCREVVKAHGGYIAQFLGDGILTYFGYPQSSEDAAERAVCCGLELVRKVAEIDSPMGYLAARVGLASGLTVVGTMNEAHAEQISVTGQAINLASRIQACVSRGTVGLADSTYRLVRGRFDCTSLGYFDLKGIGPDIHLWSARASRPIPHRWHPIGAHGLLLGREVELDCLKSIWQRAISGKSHAAVVWGEAGIGKTRLTRAFRRSAGCDATVIELQCSALHTLTALHPVASMIERAGARLSPVSTSPVARAAALLGDPSDPSAQLAATLLLPRAEGAMDIASIPAAQRRELLFDSLIRHLLEMAATRSLLVIVEDAHWSDPTTIELMRRLLTATTDEALLVVLTYRSDSQPKLVSELGLEAIHLAPLAAEIQLSIIERTSQGRMPDGAAAAIAARSDGNPLHAIEMTLSALDHGSAAPAIHLVPEFLFDGFAERLDRLGIAKPVAQNASAIGRQFSRRLLAAVTGKSPSALTAVMARLTAAKIFRPVSVGKDEFEFSHSLLQEVAYETLTKRDRVVLHSRIGEELEASPGSTDPPELIAHHWMAADKPDRALPHLVMAASGALDHGMYAEAMGHLDRARTQYDRVAQVVPRELEFDLQLSIGRASYVLNGPAHEETIDAYGKAQDLVKFVADGQRQAILLYGIFSGYHFASRFDLAAEPALRMLELAEAANSRSQMCLAHRMLGYLSFFQGNPKELRSHFDQVRASYNFNEDVPSAPMFGADHLTAIEGFASVLDAIEGRSDAVQHARQTLNHAISTEHPPSVGWAYAAGAYVEYYRRDRSSAARIASEGAKFCQDHRIAAWFAHCRLFEIWANHNRSCDDVRAIMSLAGAGIRLGLPLFRGVLAEVLSSTGAFAEALKEINSAISEAEQYGQFVFVTHLNLLRSEILSKGNLASRDEILSARNEADISARRFGSRLPAHPAWRYGLVEEEEEEVSIQLTADTSLILLLGIYGVTMSRSCR